MNVRINEMKQISEIDEENAAVQNNMKTNDDDNNMVSCTTNDGSSLMKLKMASSRSLTTPEDKGRHSRGRKRVSHAFVK